MASQKNILKLILLHFGIGVLISFFPIVAKVYSFLIILFGFYFVIKNKNRNHEVLYTSAYIIGSEVLLRSTYANSYEFAKYTMFLFLCLGIFYDGISRKAYPYLIFLPLLVPGILISVFTLESDIRRKIVFDISGPICLGVCALYTYQKKISFRKLNELLLAIGLPILSTCAFLLMNSPAKMVFIDTFESSFLFSGGFGPNQVSTILGLGMFIFCTRMLLVTSSKRMAILNLTLVAYIYYRGLLTFSRGGMITGIAIILLLFLSLYLNSKHYQQIKLKIGLVVVSLLLVSIATSYQTNGALQRRYTYTASKDAEIKEKGRQGIALKELQLFKEHPMFGVGVGQGKVIRKKESGIGICTHNEMTRLLAEHGVLGLLCILILLGMPIRLWIKNKQNIYLLSFIGFWFLTVNHSGMRIAAPAFIYGLALMNIQFNRKATIN